MPASRCPVPREQTPQPPPPSALQRPRLGPGDTGVCSPCGNISSPGRGSLSRSPRASWGGVKGPAWNCAGDIDKAPEGSGSWRAGQPNGSAGTRGRDDQGADTAGWRGRTRARGFWEGGGRGRRSPAPVSPGDGPAETWWPWTAGGGPRAQGADGRADGGEEVEGGRPGKKEDLGGSDPWSPGGRRLPRDVLTWGREPTGAGGAGPGGLGRPRWPERSRGP